MMDFKQLLHSSAFSRIDRQFARLMARCVNQEGDTVPMAAALVSRATAQGSVCLDLKQEVCIEGVADDGHEASVCQIDPSGWVAELVRSPVVGQPGDFKPMILDGTRLYLHRHWQYEQEVALEIQKRCRCITDAETVDRLRNEMADLFPEGDASQQQAVVSALTQGFTVISGGPGTGKTYTLAKLILLIKQINRTSGLRLKLAAPTGKAAMRLQQAIEAAMRAMGHDKEAQQLVNGDIQTLHRLLGARMGRSGYKYHAGNELPVDLVMVDEASMIDLALMNALLTAMPDKARLVLIGDKNQLASVEAGAVLGDICSGAVDGKGSAASTEMTDGHDGSLSGRIVLLKQGYRFGTQSDIGKLAEAVHAGEDERAQALLSRSSSVDVVFKCIDEPKMLQSAVQSLAAEHFVSSFEGLHPLEMLARLERLMILSPLRNGPYGMHALNGYVEQVLVKHGCMHPWEAGGDGWYAGRPVMVTRNDYYHQLFNGDLGVVAYHEKGTDAALSVCFSDGAGGYNTIPAQQLPAHQTAFAMTVHKSQGSEFDRVVLVLPQKETPLLTRELVYTAITRARHTLEIWGTTQSLQQAIQQRIKRTSGLGRLLWPTNSPGRP